MHQRRSLLKRYKLTSKNAINHINDHCAMVKDKNSHPRCVHSALPSKTFCTTSFIGKTCIIYCKLTPHSLLPLKGCNCSQICRLAKKMPLIANKVAKQLMIKRAVL